MKLSVSAAEASQSGPSTALPAMKRTASVPLPTKLLYGSGSLAVGAKNAVFDIFLLYYETNVLGLPGAMAGLSVFLTMCVDAVSDPLMGSISDHFRSRFGRRHLFMYMAALPVALSLYGLLSPPEGLGTTGLFVWLTTLSIAVRLSLTLYQVPSDALAPELTDDYGERTTIAGLSSSSAALSVSRSSPGRCSSRPSKAAGTIRRRTSRLRRRRPSWRSLRSSSARPERTT